MKQWDRKRNWYFIFIIKFCYTAIKQALFSFCTEVCVFMVYAIANYALYTLCSRLSYMCWLLLKSSISDMAEAYEPDTYVSPYIQEIQGICKESAHMSDRPSNQSTQHGHLSHLDSHYHSSSQKTTTLPSVDWVGKFVFLVLVPYREFRLSSYDFCLDSSADRGGTRTRT
jgi:hypothetical protein